MERVSGFSRHRIFKAWAAIARRRRIGSRPGQGATLREAVVLLQVSSRPPHPPKRSRYPAVTTRDAAVDYGHAPVVTSP
jgi:hypothetical protein